MFTVEKEYNLRSMSMEEVERLAQEIRDSREQDDIVIYIRKDPSDSIFDFSDTQTVLPAPPPETEEEKKESEVSKPTIVRTKAAKISQKRISAGEPNEKMKEDQIRREIQKIQQQYSKKQFKSVESEALKLLNRIDSQLHNNDRSKIRLILGNSCSGLNNHSQAASHYIEGIKHCTNNTVLAHLHLNLAIVYNKTNSLQSSIKHFKKLLALVSDSELGVDMGLAYQSLGEVYQKVGMYQSAILYYSQAAESRTQEQAPLESILRSNICKGNCLFSIGKIQEAVYCYRQLLKKIGPQSAAYSSHSEYINFKLAQCFTMQSKYELAISHYNNLLQSDNREKRWKILQRIADIYKQKGETESAVNYLRILENQMQNQKCKDVAMLSSIRKRISQIQ